MLHCGEGKTAQRLTFIIAQMIIRPLNDQLIERVSK